MSDNPGVIIPAVDEMREDWDIVAPLMGGTKAMRCAGRALLPQFPAEEDDTYQNRLNTSTLFPAYSETIGNMTSRVFAEPIQLGDDVPEQIAGWMDDCDLSARDLNNWAVDYFREGLSNGLCHAMVEYPRAEGVRTRAQEIEAGVRPYLVLIKPEQVLGWRTENGKLVQFRYMETIEQPYGAFDVECVDQVRVLEPGVWRTYRASNANTSATRIGEKEWGKKEKVNWELHEEGTTNLSYIPLVTFYTGRTGVMTARPPLIELAYLNVKHWQSQSDQDNLLHVARVPLLFTFTDDENFQLTISAGKATRMPAEGDAKFVEHTGAAIGAGRESLSDLVDEMRMAGAKLLQKDVSRTKTATQAEEDAAQELSPVARMAHQLQDAIGQLLKIMADYVGLPEGGSVEVRGNFDIDIAMETTVPQLVVMAEKDMISDETLFSEMQRRGVISDEHTWDEEILRLLRQSSVLDDESGALNSDE